MYELSHNVYNKINNNKNIHGNIQHNVRVIVRTYITKWISEAYLASTRGTGRRSIVPVLLILIATVTVADTGLHKVRKAKPKEPKTETWNVESGLGFLEGGRKPLPPARGLGEHHKLHSKVRSGAPAAIGFHAFYGGQKNLTRHFNDLNSLVKNRGYRATFPSLDPPLPYMSYKNVQTIFIPRGQVKDPWP